MHHACRITVTFRDIFRFREIIREIFSLCENFRERNFLKICENCPIFA
jgi:hypothetical protein